MEHPEYNCPHTECCKYYSQCLKNGRRCIAKEKGIKNGMDK
jgi:hypothetical protein